MVNGFILGVVACLIVLFCFGAFFLITHRDDEEQTTFNSNEDPRHVMIEQLHAEAMRLNRKATKEYRDGFPALGDKVKHQADDLSNRAQELLDQIHEENLAASRVLEQANSPYPTITSTTANNAETQRGYGIDA